MRFVVLRDDENAARVFVETMHDAGTQLAADAAQIAHVKEKRIHECAIGVADGRMHDQSRRLVHDDEPLVRSVLVVARPRPLSSARCAR